MTPDEFIKHLQEINKAFAKWHNDALPRIAGIEAVNFYEESFQNEGFTDETLEKWQEVKRRIDPVRPDRAAATRKILTGETADLGRSIEADPKPGQVTITADTKGAGSYKDYAKPHNEGTVTAGRNHNVTIPKRQFIGRSKTLNRKIMKITEEEAKKILK